MQSRSIFTMFDDFLYSCLTSLPKTLLGLSIIGAIIAVSLLVLGKGADILVDEAVRLSVKLSIPKILIGATVVSLGTTLPEVTVSVLSAMQGAPGLALGNAVGSIICDTGLILGIAALIKPLPFNKKTINTPSKAQLASGTLLISVSIFYGARIPQFAGFVFLGLLITYLVYTIKSGSQSGTTEEEHSLDNGDLPLRLILFKLVFGVFLVIAASKVLIPAVQEIALRFKIPETVIAATLVAFGTSLPELITAITAARKGHGELAIGNIIGADILNVLFVIGAAAAVTKDGLVVEQRFFTLLFPALFFILLIFRCAILFSKQRIGRAVGGILLASYVLVTVVSYVM